MATFGTIIALAKAIAALLNLWLIGRKFFRWVRKKIGSKRKTHR